MLGSSLPHVYCERCALRKLAGLGLKSEKHCAHGSGLHGWSPHHINSTSRLASLRPCWELPGSSEQGPLQGPH
jgi:hypothetical protein